MSTCFYLDPPYMHQTRVTIKDYEYEMSVEDHKKLLNCLSQIEGKFLLSGYRHELYDDFAQNFGWHRVDRVIDCKASSSKEKPTRTECLWMNYTQV
jgi:DNA adenine methylase